MYSNDENFAMGLVAVIQELRLNASDDMVLDIIGRIFSTRVISKETELLKTEGWDSKRILDFFIATRGDISADILENNSADNDREVAVIVRRTIEALKEQSLSGEDIIGVLLKVLAEL